MEKLCNGNHQGKTEVTERYTYFFDIAVTLFLPGYIQIIWLRRA